MLTMGSYNDGKRGFRGWTKELEKEYSKLNELYAIEVNRGKSSSLKQKRSSKGHIRNPFPLLEFFFYFSVFSIPTILF